MQTKNINVVQKSCQSEVIMMPFLSPVRESPQEVRNSEGDGSALPPPSSVYLPVPPSSKGHHNLDLTNGITSHCHQTTLIYNDSQHSPSGGCKSSAYQPLPVGGCKPSTAIYQPPPLPPRVGNPRNSNPTSPVKESHKNGILSINEALATNGLTSYGPYKPVPPPKPFAGNQVIGPHLHQQITQMEDNVHALSNGQIAYPHILVTDQGQFVTHSAKFPISEEKDKFSRFNEKNLSQGIDNPALVTDPSMGLRNHIQQHKEINPSHYAPMRAYDPAKYPQYIPNGHQPPYYRGAFSNAQHVYQEANWQSHCPINSSRFSQPSVTESTDKKLFMTNAGINQNSQDMTCYQPPCSQQSIALRGTSSAIDHGKNSVPFYPEASVNQHEQLLKYDHSGKVSFSLANGMVHGDMNCRNHYTTSTSANGEVNGHSSGTNNEVNGLPQGCDIDKKDDKWESLKRASKKCSNFKNIISNKFNKNEPKTSSNGINTTLSKGTNSQDLAKPITDNNTEILNSERLHNGENHLQENQNFQRVVTYSSLKSRLEGPPQQTYNPPAFFGSERQSGRLPHASSSNIPSSCSYGTQTQSSGIIGPPKRAESCTHLGVPVNEPVPKLPQWGIHHRSDDNLTRPLASDQAYPEHITKVKESANAHFHPGREGRVSGSSDSGRGTGGGSATEFKGHDTSLESGSSTRNPMPGHSSESEWIDIPDSEAKQITLGTILSNSSKYPDGSKTPPLPPLSPEGTPKLGARNSKSKKANTHRNTKPDIVPSEKGSKKTGNSSGNENTSTHQNSTHASRPAKSKGWNERNTNTVGTSLIGGDRRINGPQNRFTEQSRIREKEWRTFDNKGNFDDDEITSTDAALDLNSVLDGATEITTDDDLASNRDDDAYLIRRQLEGLEGMYSEVLKVLGGGKRNVRAADPRLLRRRTHGSMSSLPSSVMSNRAIRDKKGGKVIDDRLRRTNKDVSKSTHRRFQRLESHVVTLARSVAHLSSEMRTQQLMLQEIESIRNDLSALKMNVKAPSGIPVRGGLLRGSRLWNGIGSGNPSFSNPGRVKKLTQFFGDEPPLVRIFLKKLGYEKYAPIFEQEKIGMLELPYMTEERLQKIGIPLGPRLRILEESRGPITTDGNLSVYVV